LSFSPKCSKYRSEAALCPDPLRTRTALPRTPSWIKGPTSKERGDEGREGERMGGEGRQGEICLLLIFLLATPQTAS